MEKNGISLCPLFLKDILYLLDYKCILFLDYTISSDFKLVKASDEPSRVSPVGLKPFPATLRETSPDNLFELAR